MMEAATWKRRQIWVEPELDDDGKVKVPGYWKTDPKLPWDKARLQEYGSVIHAWHYASRNHRSEWPDAGKFTQQHLNTAEQIQQCYQAYKGAMAIKQGRSVTDDSPRGGVDGADPFAPEREERDLRAIENWKAIRHEILKSGPFGMMAVQTVVLDNKEVPSLIGDLRLALNAVARLWERRRAA
ncbi:hypothetical protein [Nitratireductor basaltis]|nr:hypothetical protein [Nitratireductor basaltis]